MLPLSDLQTMNVLWATPCYISAVSMNYVTSMFELTHEAIQLGLRSSLHMRSESLVTRGRNEIVKFFLMHEEYTHLFWIDADIAFHPSAAIRLLLSGHDVAAGIYPIKRLNWPIGGTLPGMDWETFEALYTDYPFNLPNSGEGTGSDPVVADGFVEVAEAPTGFMSIRREVFTDLMQHYPDLNYVPDGLPDNPEAPYYWRFFDCMVDPDSNRYLSEDYAFCRRWRDIGGRVFADLNSNLGHLGQHMFRGDLALSIKLRTLDESLVPSSDPVEPSDAAQILELTPAFELPEPAPPALVSESDRSPEGDEAEETQMETPAPKARKQDATTKAAALTTDVITRNRTGKSSARALTHSI